MSAKPVIQSVLAVALLVCTTQALDIEMVTVGNPGNTADKTGYGEVDYEYNIGKYEVTCAQYVDFLNAVAASDPHGLYNTSMSWSTWGCKIQRSGTSGSYTYSVTGDRANRPVNYVSWYDAARFSNWLTTGDTESGVYTFSGAATVTNILDHETAAETLGKTVWFIPTEDEWYKAAYHKNDGATGNYFDYPTSSDAVPSHDLIYPDPGNNANFYQNGYTIGSPYYTTEVGAFANSESPYGTFDQCGNVWEWNESLVTGSERGLRGGYWWNSSVSLHASDRYFNYPTHENYHIGFRVASIPERLPGDMNDDGVVNSRDLDIVRSWWGEEVEPGRGDRGDANGDGLVNSADLDIVRANWGAGIAAVPEPGVLFLVFSSAVLLAWRRGRGRCLACVVMLVGGMAQGAEVRYRVVDLGDLGGTYAEAIAINDNGLVVGQSTTVDGNYRGFLYDGATMHDLGTLGGDTSIAYDISDSAAIVGAAGGSGGTEACRWSGMNPVGLGVLEGGGLSGARGTNSVGVVVGMSLDSMGHRRPVKWDANGVIEDLGTLGGSGGNATAVNDVGQIVGNANPSGDGTSHAFLYQDGTMQGLGTFPGGYTSDARDISADGQVVGWSGIPVGENMHTRPFLYDGGPLIDLGSLGGEEGWANGINDLTQIVGQSRTSSGDWHAFIWEGGTMVDLNDSLNPASGWVLRAAQDINSHGQIVGTGSSPFGHTRAFLLTPIPEGDLDGDGIVNSRDLDIVRAWWGAEVEPGNGLMGDATGDGLVNSKDLDLVRANWGTRVAGSAVPEPSTLIFVLSTLAFSMVRCAMGNGRARRSKQK